MSKDKISEYSSTAASNTDIGGININEGCAPSNINNAIRELMAQIKDFQQGADGDGLTVSTLNATTATVTTVNATNLNVGAANFLSAVYPVGSIYINAAVATNPGTLLGFGTWTAFGAGRVMVGFDSTDALFDTAEETGGSKDAVVVSHTHTATSTVTDPGHVHNAELFYDDNNPRNSFRGSLGNNSQGLKSTNTATTGITVATTNSTEGSSGTNANLQPYITVYMWKRTA